MPHEKPTVGTPQAMHPADEPAAAHLRDLLAAIQAKARGEISRMQFAKVAARCQQYIDRLDAE